jgi:biotin carboxyl carrier protein
MIERRENKFFIIYDNNEYTVTASELKPGQLKITLGDRTIKSIISEGKDSKYIFIDGNIFHVKRVELTGRKKEHKKDPTLTSPISGTIVSVKAKPKDKVRKGDVIMIIEAMKMEYLIRAPYNGTIAKINYKEKDQIEIGEITAELIPEEQ